MSPKAASLFSGAATAPAAAPTAPATPAATPVATPAPATAAADPGAAATPDPGPAATGHQPPPGTEEWQAAGYEAPWLQKFAGGKYKKEVDAFKGYDEFGSLINTRAEEAKSAQAKAAELAQKLAGVEGIIGAPVDETGKPKPYDFGWTDPAAVAPELASGLESVLRKHNLSEAVAKDIVPLAEEYAAAVALGSREAEIAGAMLDYGFKQEEIEAALADPTKFGEHPAGKDAQARLASLAKFWEERAGDNPALVEAIYGVASRREGIRLLELLRSDLSAIKNGSAGHAGAPESADAILKAAAGDSSYFLRNPDAYTRLLAAREREASGK